MRLIDADALDEVLDEFESLKAHAAFTEGIMVARRELTLAPPIDAEPVRHGRWIQSKTVPSYHSCSYCKRAHNMPKSCNVYVLPYYCMDCGTKMDLEKGIDR